MLNKCNVEFKIESMADVRENFEISKEDPKYMICTICGSRFSKDSKETTFQKHLETKKHLKERKRLEDFSDRKGENDSQRRRGKRNLKQKCEALEKIRESFRTEETEELETFVHFKLTARPEAFRELIEHMKYYEEAEGVISALSARETENKTPEKLEEERRPTFLSIPHTKSSNPQRLSTATYIVSTANISDGELDNDEVFNLNDLKYRPEVLLDRKGQKNQSINSENYDKGSNVQKKKETCKFLKFGKCRHGLSGKDPDQEKVCSYNHPPVCREHEKRGKCFDKRCAKYHLKICREFMNNQYQYCTYGDDCKFWHPTGLKDFRLDHERKEHYSKEEIPTESRVFYGKNHSYFRQQEISKIVGRLKQIEIQIQIQNKQLLNPQVLPLVIENDVITLEDTSEIESESDGSEGWVDRSPSSTSTDDRDNSYKNMI